MDDINSILGVETAPVDLHDIMPTPLPSLTPPLAAVRNRAATVALLSEDPTKSVDNFQLMMAEAEQGTDSIVKYQQDRIISQASEEDKQSFMSVLSDPKIDMGRKMSLIDALHKDRIRKDVTTKLMTNAAAKASEGETPEAEDARVGSVADHIAEIYESRERIQGLVNAHAASLDGTNTALGVFEVADAWVAPLSSNITMNNLVNNSKGSTMWDVVKASVLPGSSKRAMYQKFQSLPLEQREQFVKDQLQNISQNTETLLSNSNQFAQYELISQLFDEGASYTAADAGIENAASLLDIVGLGFLLRTPKGLKNLAKDTGVTDVVARTPASSSPASSQVPRSVQPSDLARVEGVPTKGVFDDRIASLESTKASLLGDASNALDKGAVASLNAERKQIVASLPDVKALAKDIQVQQGITSKAAKERANSIFEDKKIEVDGAIARIDSQLEANKQSSLVNQKIANIEKEIELLQKNNTEIFLKKDPLADAIGRIDLNGAVRRANPASPMEVIKLANPQQARNMLELIVKSEGDAVANGLAGTSRLQAITNDVFPQVVTSSGRVAAQPVDIQRNLRRELQVPDSIYKAIWDDGGIMYTPQEKAAALSNVQRDFQSAEGLVMRENMGGFQDDGLRFNISAVYGTPEGDFKNARQAYEQARYALRKQGVLDSEIEILRKEGLDYVPVKLADVGEAEGSYVVRVNTKHEVDPTDVVKFEEGDVKLNFLDRLPGTQWGQHGSAARYLLDASSMLDPKYTKAATAATDRSAGFEKLLLDVAKEYSDIFVKLPKEAQIRVDSYLREANYNQLAFDIGDLRKRGMSDKEISSVRAWRRFWDGHFYLENLDVVRTLNSEGYQKFSSNNADFFAKRMEKNRSISRVYDPATDTLVDISASAIDQLYDTKGFIAKTRRPVEIDGVSVEHMIVRNTPTEYLRKFRDNDMVLNYREGYFQLQYDAARFVDEISTGANGQQIRRAVAVGGSMPEVTRFAERMNANAPAGVRYVPRADERALQRGSDDWFDVNSASGRIAQRHRGKLLEDGSGMNHLGDGSYILDPVTSAIRAARSVAGRTVTRPMLEASKARFMSQYKDVLPPDGMGGVRMPRSSSEIGSKGMVVSKQVADARTVFNNIHYLENGYINGLDSVWKQMFHALADKAGNWNLGKTEKALLATGDISPAQSSKVSVFMATIGSHPLRQLVVQPHQVIRTMSYNTVGWAKGTVPRLMTDYFTFKAKSILGQNVKMSKEAQAFVDFVENSGAIAAIDKQNLVRGTLMDAAGGYNALSNTVGKPLEILRKVGFDTGEAANTVGHLAAVYEREIRAGKDMTNKALRDEAYSTSRAISWDMNFAGDMPYNQTAPSLVLQFMQVPHKAFLQLFNRRLRWQDRGRLVLGDVIFWGPPTLLVSELLGGDILPEDKDLRELVTYGLESAILNKLFQSVTDDPDVNIDWSSLAPYDAHGWAKTLYGFFTGGPYKAVAESPAGQLFLADGGRVQNALGSISRLFGMSDQIGETPETFQRTLNEVLKISSGWSAGTKAYLMLESEKRMDKYGRPVSEKVQVAEAVAQAFGFGDSSQRDNWALIEKSNSIRKNFRDDVLKDYKNILQYYQTEMNKGIADPVQLGAVSSFVLKRYQGNPEALQIIQQQLEKDLLNPEYKLLSQMIKISGIPDANTLKDKIRQSNIPDAQKQQILDRFQHIEDLK